MTFTVKRALKLARNFESKFTHNLLASSAGVYDMDFKHLQEHVERFIVLHSNLFSYSISLYIVSPNPVMRWQKRSRRIHTHTHNSTRSSLLLCITRAYFATVRKVLAQYNFMLVYRVISLSPLSFPSLTTYLFSLSLHARTLQLTSFHLSRKFIL